MKTKNSIRLFALCILSIVLMRFTQETAPVALEQLGKGTIYMKDNTIIKNVLLKEIKTFWIVYEKQQSLHDKLMEAIERIEFPDAKPFPAKMTFEKNQPVVRRLETIH
jgi:hypothetical protein